MKKYLLFSGFFLFAFSLQIFSQEKKAPTLDTIYKPCKDCKDSNVLIYDFACQHYFYKGQWVKNPKIVSAFFNEEFKVKIVNINRYLYNVSVTADDLEFSSDAPELFNQLFLGNGNYLTGLLSALGNSVDPSKKIESTDSANSFNSSTNILINTILTFRNKYYPLLDKQEWVNRYCPKEFECCDKKVLLNFSELTNDFFLLKTEFQRYSVEVLSQSMNLQRRIDSVQKEWTECEKERENLRADLKKTNKPQQKREIQAQMDSLNCKKLKGAVDSFIIARKLLDTMKVSIDKFWAEVSKITDEDLMKLIVFSNNLVNDHFFYSTPPIFPKGNFLNVAIKISPTDSSWVKKWNSYPLRDDSLGIEIFVKNKWSVNFSSGPFVGIGKGLQNENFDAQAQPDANGIISSQSQYKLVSTGRGSAPLGLAAFATLGTKWTRGFGLGVSIGAGVTIENKPRPVYFLGGTMSLGDKKQLNLMAGVALAQVNKLKSELYPNPDILYASKPTDIEYSKKLGVGGFVSLTYTIFNLNSSRASSSKSKR